MASGLKEEETVRNVSKLNTPDNPVVENLQKALANSIVLYINYKHYHWQVSGPTFRDLHLMFDELAKDVQKSLDEVAERIRMIGQDPLFTLNEIQNTCSIQPTRVKHNLREMIEEADRNAIQMIAELREGFKLADDAGDPGTADLITDTLRSHEKHEWFLRELLRSDGLVEPRPSRRD